MASDAELIERLKDGAAKSALEAKSNGRTRGESWAKRYASIHDLRRIQKLLPNAEIVDSHDAHQLYSCAFPNDECCCGHLELALSDLHQTDAKEYLLGFLEAAADVYAEVEDKI
jgi:hypothetical protein